MTNRQIIQTFKDAKTAKLKTYAFNMIGVPFETKKTIEKTINLNKIIQPDFIGGSLFNAFYGTEIYELAKNENMLKEKLSESYFKESNIRNKFGFKVYIKKRPIRGILDLIDKKYSKNKNILKIKNKILKYGIRKII